MDPRIAALFDQKRSEISLQIGERLAAGESANDLAAVFVINTDTDQFECGVFERVEAHRRFVVMTPKAPRALKAQIKQLGGPPPDGHVWLVLHMDAHIVVSPLKIYAQNAVGDA